MNQEHESRLCYESRTCNIYKKGRGVKEHFSTPITPGFRKAEENQVDPVSCQNICS